MEFKHLSAALDCPEMFDYSIFVFILFLNLHIVNMVQYRIFVSSNSVLTVCWWVDLFLFPDWAFVFKNVIRGQSQKNVCPDLL